LGTQEDAAVAGCGSTEDWDDATLVGRSVSGDDRAFEVLVRRYQAALYRHAWRLTQDRRTAEDVVQEAFVTAWRRLPTLDRAESFRSWLYQITTRRSIDVVRARRPEQPVDTVAPVTEPVSTEAGPATRLEQRAQIADLAAALQELSVGQRAAWSSGRSTGCPTTRSPPSWSCPSAPSVGGSRGPGTSWPRG
jgi:RNA polymerase sigma-70 factor (ECF subfamily)